MIPRIAPLLVGALLFTLAPLVDAASAAQSESEDCGLHGENAYSSPSYDYSLVWDAGWRAEDCSADSQNAYDVLVLTNEISDVVLEGAPNSAADAEACVQAEYDRLGNREDVDDLLLTDQGPLPLAAWNGIAKVYTYTRTQANREAKELAGLKWCALIQPNASLVITVVAPQQGFEEQFQAGLALVAGLGASPGTASAQPPESPSGEELTEQRAALMDFLHEAESDVDEFWSRTLPTLPLANGQVYTPPSYQPYDAPIRTPCHPTEQPPAQAGPLGEGAGPFYCPLNQTVYLDLLMAQSEVEVFGRIAVVQGIAHEVGHHVQSLLGLEKCFETPCLGSELTSRQYENMADCFGGAWTRDAEVAEELGAQDVGLSIAEIAAFFGESRLGAADPGLHGTSAQRVEWFLKGYNDGAQACLSTDEQGDPAAPAVATQPPSSTAASTGAQAATYVSPTYGYSLIYDTSWEVASQTSENGIDTLQLQDEPAFVTIQGAAEYRGDPEACVDDLVEQRILNGPGYSNTKLKSEGTEGPTSAYAIYDYTYTFENGNSGPFTDIIQCETLVTGQSVVAFWQSTPAGAYADYLDAFNALVAGLSLPEVSPTTGTVPTGVAPGTVAYQDDFEDPAASQLATSRQNPRFIGTTTRGASTSLPRLIPSSATL